MIILTEETMRSIGDFFYSKYAIMIGWFSTGLMTTDAVVKKVKPEIVEQGLSLADWQIILGMIFTISMIIPRFYAGYVWLRKKFKKTKN